MQVETWDGAWRPVTAGQDAANLMDDVTGSIRIPDIRHTPFTHTVFRGKPGRGTNWGSVFWKDLGSEYLGQELASTSPTYPLI